MTTNDIDAIRKLTDAAEHGPWRVVEEHGRDIADEAYTRLTIQTDDPAGSIEVAELVDPDHSWSSQLPEENAAFIAAARTLLPACADEIEQLRAALDDIRARHAAMDRALTGLRADHKSALRANTAYANENERLRNALLDVAKSSGKTHVWDHQEKDWVPVVQFVTRKAKANDKPCCGYCGTETPIGVTR